MSELKSSRRIISDQSTIFISRALKSPLTIMWLSNFKRMFYFPVQIPWFCQPLRAKWTKKTFWGKKAILIEGVTVWCGIKDLYHDLPAANGRLMLHIGNTEQWRPYIFCTYSFTFTRRISRHDHCCINTMHINIPLSLPQNKPRFSTGTIRYFTIKGSCKSHLTVVQVQEAKSSPTSLFERT